MKKRARPFSCFEYANHLNFIISWIQNSDTFDLHERSFECENNISSVAFQCIQKKTIVNTTSLEFPLTFDTLSSFQVSSEEHKCIEKNDPLHFIIYRYFLDQF